VDNKDFELEVDVMRVEGQISEQAQLLLRDKIKHMKLTGKRVRVLETYLTKPSGESAFVRTRGIMGLPLYERAHVSINGNSSRWWFDTRIERWRTS
jgi:hypothetical protein